MPEPSELLLRYAECTDDDDSFDSTVEDEFFNGQDPWDDNPYKGRVFHKFSELPPELRIKIWEFGLASLDQPRMLEFRLCHVTRRERSAEVERDGFGVIVPLPNREWAVYPDSSLLHETKTVRKIMAVNREARGVARRISPDTLKVEIKPGGGHGTVYFNRHRDIVQVNGPGRGHMHPFAIAALQDSRYHMEGFAENVVQLAITRNDLNFRRPSSSTHFAHAMDLFPNLKRLFVVSPNIEHNASEVLWCGSDYIHVHTKAILDGRHGPFWTKRCWPNADDYDDYARNEIPAPKTLLRSESLELLSTRGIELHPMVVFEGQIGLLALEKLQAKWRRSYAEGIPVEELSDGGSDDDEVSETDEYESEGINDSEMEETNSEEDEDDNRVSGDEIYGDDDDDISSVEIVPIFSSPEPEPIGSATVAPSSGKRPIVSDSQDEGVDVSEGPRGKRARTNHSPPQTFTSDTEDEVVNRPNGAGRGRRRAAIVDSDDDDGDGATRTGLYQHESSSQGEGEGSLDNDQEDVDEGESDDEDEEEKEDLDVRQMSLAARLQLVRETHLSSSEEESDDETSLDGDDDDEDHDDDEERSEDELIDGIAEESDASEDY